MQREISLPAAKRGYHLITQFIMDAIGEDLPAKGVLHVFIKHTSAALTINEAVDPDVLYDFENIMNHIVPENLPFLRHTIEGPDDMPAHIKAALIGNSITIPITNHQLNLGTWQGIYLCEFRNRASSRSIICTILR